jgi:diadenosine tetraphosphate (Ap4A) HIT family hydrolase
MSLSRSPECFFCTWDEPDKHRIIAESELAYVRLDDSPETDGHSLVIPKMHIENFFGLTPSIAADMLDLSQQAKKTIDEMYNPDGYNIITNVGRAAGQVMMHAHLHIVPRYDGDGPVILR